MWRFELILFLLTISGGLFADVSRIKYKVPEGFEDLLNVQEADIDLVLGGQLIGQGRITVRDAIYRLPRLYFQQPVFKPDAGNWIKERCSEGVPAEGVVCDDSLHSRLGCVKGKRLLTINYSPEKLIATLIVDPALLESSGNLKHQFIPRSTANYPSAVADYTLNQSYTRNSQNYYLNLGASLSVGEKHVRTSVKNILNQSYFGSEQYGELNELYYRQDWEGRYFTAGLQNQWDFYSELSGSQSFHPRQDVIAFNWGTSSKTEDTGQSAAVFPVQVFMPDAGRVEVYLDGALLATEAVGAGLSTLKTTYWPRGVYDIEIKTYVAGKPYDTQKQTVFKDSPGEPGKADSLWIGVSAPWERRIYGGSASRNSREYKPFFGGSVNYPLKEGVVGSIAAHLSEISSSVELGGRLFLVRKTPLIVSFTMTEHQSSGLKARLSSRFDNISVSGAYEFFQANHRIDREYFMQDHQRLSIYTYWSLRKAVSVIFSVKQDIQHNETLKTVDVQKRWQLNSQADLESRISLHHGARRKQNSLGDDVFAASGIMVNLTLTLLFRSASNNHSRLATAYTNNHSNYVSVQGSFQQSFRHSLVHQVAVSGDVSGEKQHLWSSAGLKSPYVKGYAGTGFYKSREDEQWMFFTNFSGQLGVKGNVITAGAGQTQSGALLMVSDSGQGLLRAEVNGQPYPLERARTFIPLQPYRMHSFKVMNNKKSDSELQIERDYFQCTLYPGNVVQFEVNAWEPVDIIGQVVDKTGAPLRRLKLKNSRNESVTDNQGMFSMTFDRRSLTLMGRKGGKQCLLDLSNIIPASQMFYRLEAQTCRLE